MTQQPVKRQLKNFVHLCSTNSEYSRRLANLTNVIKSDEWKFVMEVLWSIKNQMARELLEDKKYTELPPDEKDRLQTVYSNINEWINFLTNPMGWVRKYGMIQMFASHLSKVRASTKPEKGKQK